MSDSNILIKIDSIQYICLLENGKYKQKLRKSGPKLGNDGQERIKWAIMEKWRKNKSKLGWNGEKLSTNEGTGRKIVTKRGIINVPKRCNKSHSSYVFCLFISIQNVLSKFPNPFRMQKLDKTRQCSTNRAKNKK